MIYRELNEMPFDKAFVVDGNEELCHATGLEARDENDPDSPEFWWNEYVDRNGSFHYGR